MIIPEHIFREYDIRGLVENELTPPLVQALGQAIGTELRRRGGRTLVVGMDCRLSGPALSEALVSGVRSTGCDVLHIGVVPTPVAYWAIVHFGADGGVQVTGSHNPPEYNGLKITLRGSSVHGDGIRALRDRVQAQDYESGAGTVETREALGPYIDALATNLAPAQKPLKVVVDAGNGTGGMSAVPLYRRLGFEVIDQYCEPDGTFPNHHPDPTVEANLEPLRARVHAEKADVGIAFDGDGDRIGVIDRDGAVVWGDRLVTLLARGVLAASPGATIIGEVKCSKTLYDDIAKHGGQPLMWRTGHSLIKAKMKETDAALAGEMSGHIFFKHRYHGFDDATYAGGRLLELLSQDPRSIGEHLADVPVTVSTPEIRRACPDATKFAVVDGVRERLRDQSGIVNLVDIDGVRAEWEDGWGLVRPSNTGPVLVLRFEAESPERLTAIQSLFEQTLEAAQAAVAD